MFIVRVGVWSCSGWRSRSGARLQPLQFQGFSALGLPTCPKMFILGIVKKIKLIRPVCLNYYGITPDIPKKLHTGSGVSFVLLYL